MGTLKFHAERCTVLPVLSGPLRTLDPSPDDWGSGWHDRPPHPLKKMNLQINVAGDNGGSQMYVYLQCEFYTKTFNKPVFMFCMPTSNY